MIQILVNWKKAAPEINRRDIVLVNNPAQGSSHFTLGPSSSTGSRLPPRKPQTHLWPVRKNRMFIALFSNNILTIFTCMYFCTPTKHFFRASNEEE